MKKLKQLIDIEQRILSIITVDAIDGDELTQEGGLNLQTERFIPAENIEDRSMNEPEEVEFGLADDDNVPVSNQREQNVQVTRIAQNSPKKTHSSDCTSCC